MLCKYYLAKHTVMKLAQDTRLPTLREIHESQVIDPVHKMEFRVSFA